MIAIDKYQIVSRLGGGSFGEVFRVVDRALQAEKAVKVLAVTDPALFMSSLEEAQILNRCRHKHIVSINEANIFQVSGQPRVVLDLEFVPEGSLEDALRNRWVSIRDSVNALRGALLGLEHAHSQGFLHRDIKPGNILLGSAASKLSDFGLATGPGATLTGSARGYRTHLPAEYFRTRTTTVLTDIFAAGVTLFRATSNFSDWRAVVGAIPNSQLLLDQGRLINHIGFEAYVPKLLKKIVEKACHVDPSKRFQSAKEFCQRLDRIRFGTDWIRVADYEWHGYSTGDAFTCHLSADRNERVIAKNGRRQNAFCKRYDTLGEATKGIEEHIAETTLLVA